MLQLLIGEIFLKEIVKCDEGFLDVVYSNLYRKSIVDSVSWACTNPYRINLIDILFPFAKGVPYRESGVLNSHRPS